MKRVDEHRERLMKHWMAQAAAGSQSAFSALYQEFVPRLYGYLRLQMSHDGDIQDLMQDIFVTIWRSAASYSGTSTVAAWVFGIARHKLLDWLRVKHKKSQLEITRLEDMADRPEFAGQAFEESLVTELAVASAVATLPPHYAELFYLVFVESMSYKEVSALLGIHEGTVKSRMYQVRIRLRQQLEEGGADGGGHV